MTRPSLNPDGSPARLLRRLYRAEKVGKWPEARPYAKYLCRLIELDLVVWPVGAAGTLTEAGRRAGRVLEASS